ncbi:hypothetical protein R8Z50_23740 [Longispora sp. K20-0274]
MTGERLWTRVRRYRRRATEEPGAGDETPHTWSGPGVASKA